LPGQKLSIKLFLLVLGHRPFPPLGPLSGYGARIGAGLRRVIDDAIVK